jgi:hypothetical protein
VAQKISKGISSAQKWHWSVAVSSFPWRNGWNRIAVWTFFKWHSSIVIDGQNQGGALARTTDEHDQYCYDSAT